VGGTLLNYDDRSLRFGETKVCVKKYESVSQKRAMPAKIVQKGSRGEGKIRGKFISSKKATDFLSIGGDNQCMVLGKQSS